MREAIPLGRIAGFPVKIHWSVIVILWSFTWSLATTLPGPGPDRPSSRCAQLFQRWVIRRRIETDLSSRELRERSKKEYG